MRIEIFFETMSKRKLAARLDSASCIDKVQRVISSLDSIVYFSKQVSSFERIHDRLEMLSRVNIDQFQLTAIVKAINNEHPFYEMNPGLIIHIPHDQRAVSNILKRKEKLKSVLTKEYLVKELSNILEGDFGIILESNPLKKMKCKVLPKKVAGPLDIMLKGKEYTPASPLTSEVDVPVKLSPKERIQQLKQRVLQRKKERELAMKSITTETVTIKNVKSPQKDVFLSLLMDLITTKFISDRRLQSSLQDLSIYIAKSNNYKQTEVEKGILDLSNYFSGVQKSKYFKCYTWKDDNKYVRCLPEDASKIFHKQWKDGSTSPVSALDSLLSNK